MGQHGGVTAGDQAALGGRACPLAGGVTQPATRDHFNGGVVELLYVLRRTLKACLAHKKCFMIHHYRDYIFKDLI